MEKNEIKDYKCYKFEANTSGIIEGYVYAHDKEEAKQLILLECWEELEKQKIETVEEITEIREEEN
jgi:hypothetical protein